MSDIIYVMSVQNRECGRVVFHASLCDYFVFLLPVGGSQSQSCPPFSASFTRDVPSDMQARSWAATRVYRLEAFCKIMARGFAVSVVVASLGLFLLWRGGGLQLAPAINAEPLQI